MTRLRAARPLRLPLGLGPSHRTCLRRSPRSTQNPRGCIRTLDPSPCALPIASVCGMACPHPSENLRQRVGGVAASRFHRPPSHRIRHRRASPTPCLWVTPHRAMSALAESGIDPLCFSLARGRHFAGGHLGHAHILPMGWCYRRAHRSADAWCRDPGSRARKKYREARNWSHAPRPGSWVPWKKTVPSSGSLEPHLLLGSRCLRKKNIAWVFSPCDVLFPLSSPPLWGGARGGASRCATAGRPSRSVESCHQPWIPHAPEAKTSRPAPLSGDDRCGDSAALGGRTLDVCMPRVHALRVGSREPWKKTVPS